MSNSTTLVQKLRNYCNILRDNSLSYGDYMEKLESVVLANLQRASSLRQKHSENGIHGGTRMSLCCYASSVFATARPARLRQSNLERAFDGGSYKARPHSR